MPITQVPKELIKNINPSQINPEGALNGHVLCYSSSAGAWVPANPSVFGGLPSGTNGQFLIYNGSLGAWVASTVSNFIDKPTNPIAGQVLTYNGSTWVAGAGSSGGARLPTATAGQILRYDGTAWVAADNVDTIPIGTIHYFATQVPPTGYLECNGTTISQSLFADLYAIIGTRYNTGGEGIGTFRLPDLRGEFIRGWDSSNLIDPNRFFGSKQLDSYKSHKHGVTLSHESGGGKDSYGWPGTDTTGPIVFHSETEADNSSCDSNGGGNFMASSGGSETRPRNVALLPCIKALKTTTATAQVLNYVEKPAGATNGQVLTYDSVNARWIAAPAGGGSASLPAGLGGQVLTYNGYTNTWVPSAAPSFSINSAVPTVGNAKLGIFASAVCFIPSNPGSGTWTAPEGCYSARVTLVGGGAGNFSPNSDGGGRSHFNYPTGSTTQANQLFADGGKNVGNTGGRAGWNGINNLAIGGDAGAGGKGGSGGGGYGGGGGGGSPGGSSGGGSYGGGGKDNEYSQAYRGAGGGSGGVGGDGGDGFAIEVGYSGFNYLIGGAGGGSPTLSYAATTLPNLSAALSQNVGRGNFGGAGAGWCSAVISVIPNQSYTYGVGNGGGDSNYKGSYGMVVIEW